MIKIHLSLTLKKEIENLHWNYFESNCLSTFKDIISKEKDKLTIDILSFLLDSENDNNRLRNDILFGNQNKHENAIEHINMLISSKFNSQNLDELTHNLELTRQKIPAYSNFTKDNLNNNIASLENACQFIDDLKKLFNSQKPIETVAKAKETGRFIRKKYKQLADGYKERYSEIIRYKASLRTKLEKIFDYDEFVQSYEGWGAYLLTTKLSINSCPYCNRSYIHTHKTEKNGKTRPHLDHFYSKSDYPYLALSIYNLIPSCYICNSSFKGSTNFYTKKHLHPYEYGFGNDGVFTTEFIKDENGLYNLSLISKETALENFDLKIKVSDTSPIKFEINNSIETFQIEALYKKHKDYILEIIRKSVLYNADKIKELTNETFKGLFESKEELIQTLIGNYIQENKLNKRSLSKLTKDIWDEFGLKDIWKI